MKILDTVKSFFPVVYISIVLEERSCHLCIQITKKGKLQKEEKKEFKAYGSEMPIDAINIIKKYQKSYRFCYVAALLNSINQGALGTCKRGEFAKYQVEAENVEAICMDEKWSVYSYADDIAWAKRTYEKSGGLDFIFSPFAVLHELVSAQLSAEPKLYVLSQNSSIALAIMSEEGFQYGGYFILAPTETLESAEGDEEEGGDAEADTADDGDLGDDIEELESLDDIDGLSDLDDLEDEVKLDEFEELEDAGVDEKSSKGPSRLSDANSSLEELGKGMDILNFIKDSIEKYYKSDLYESTFIEDIVFINDSQLSDEVVDYIHSTLLLNVSKEQVNISEKMCEMAISEVQAS